LKKEKSQSEIPSEVEHHRKPRMCAKRDIGAKSWLDGFAGGAIWASTQTSGLPENQPSKTETARAKREPCQFYMLLPREEGFITNPPKLIASC